MTQDITLALETENATERTIEVVSLILKNGKGDKRKMNKEEMKNKISMALKDPILQQGFECICKENAELKETVIKMNNVITETFSNLSKAKELLERLLITSCNSDVLNLLPNCSEVLRVRVEAEQFISEVEK